MQGGGDVAVARIAAAQYGVISVGQLLSAGIGRSGIAHRARTGRLHRVHRGVYLVGHPVPPVHARETAALLACGPQAVLSHETAAASWGLPVREGRDVDVTLPLTAHRERPGIRVHRSRTLTRRDVRIKDDLPVTAPARTLIDLAEVLPARALSKVLAEAQVRRLVRRQDLEVQLARSSGRRGVAQLKALLDGSDEPALLRSEAEAQLLDLMRKAGLPPTGVNQRVLGHEVDFVWLPQRVVVEVDGYAYHAGRRAFERDRARDAELVAAGHRVLRVSWLQLTRTPEVVVARVAQALARD